MFFYLVPIPPQYSVKFPPQTPSLSYTSIIVVETMAALMDALLFAVVAIAAGTFRLLVS